MNTSKTMEELEAMSTPALMDEFGFNTPDNDQWVREDSWFERVVREIILDSVAQRGCCTPELPDNTSPPREEQTSKEERRIKKVLDEWCPTPEELLQLEYQIRIMNVADRWLEEWRKEVRESEREEDKAKMDDSKDDKIVKQEIDPSKCDKKVKQESGQPDCDKKIKQEDDESDCDRQIKQEDDGPKGDKEIKQEPSED